MAVGWGGVGRGGVWRGWVRFGDGWGGSLEEVGKIMGLLYWVSTGM